MRILWLKTAPLHPLDTGGKLRTYNMLKALRRQHRITYLSLCPANTPEAVLEQASEYSTNQRWIPWEETRKGSFPFYLELLGNALLSRRPYIIGKYLSASMSRAVRDLDRDGAHDVVVCDFLAPSANLVAASDTVSTPTVLFQHNVESMIWERLTKTAETSLKRAYFRMQWQRMRRFEATACAWFDGVIGVSPEDCQVMREEYGLDNVLGHVPTGVDADYFQAVTRPRRAGSVLFLGSMDWMPNIDAVEFFVEQAYGHVKQGIEGATLTVVGRNPPQAVTQLAARDPTITVTGTVPDVRPYLAEATVCVVPLRVGGGTRIKIFEAMAAGLPVVSTRIGAEGLPVEHEEHLLLADDPRHFAEAVVRLLSDPGAAHEMAARALTLVREQFSWDAATRVFEELCDGVVACSPRFLCPERAPHTSPGQRPG